MAIIKVTSGNRPRRVELEEVQDLFWYDAERKEMFRYEGSRLVYANVLDKGLPEPKYRLMPKAVVDKVVRTVMKRDVNDVIGWFKEYATSYGTASGIVRADKESITFSVPDEEVGQFSKNLNRQLTMSYSS